MPVEAVIFDWGGTLSLYADIELADMWRLAARHLAPDREDELCRVMVAVEDESWQRVAQDQTSTTLSQLVAEASRRLGLDVAEALLEEAALHHLDSWTPHIVHDPDAAPVLQALRARGLRIGLLSNTHWPRSFHEHFLERDGLVDLIDVRLYTSEMTHTKPHPKVFREAARALDVHPSAAVFVGDRPFDDVYGAKSMGMRGVLRPNPAVPGFDVQPDGVIEHLPELVELVDDWISEEHADSQ